MTCPYNGSKRTHDGWITYPCGKCLQCRIGKQSSWILRNQLEYRSAHSRSFWTLTLADHGLRSLATDGPRNLIRTFFAALRHSESRAGNSSPIRFFGCQEFGGLFGRPHFHFLIYNLRKNYIESARYRHGQPRQRIQLRHWPHGHIDTGQVTPSTMRYVASYLTEFQTPDGANVLFATKRPGIGFYGLDSLAASLALKQSAVPWPLEFIAIGNRTYRADSFTKKTLYERLRHHNVPITLQTPEEAQLYRLSFDQAALETIDPIKATRTVLERALRHEHSVKKAAEREVAAAKATIARSRAKNAALAQDPHAGVEADRPENLSGASTSFAPSAGDQAHGCP